MTEKESFFDLAFQAFSTAAAYLHHSKSEVRFLLVEEKKKLYSTVYWPLHVIIIHHEGHFWTIFYRTFLEFLESWEDVKIDVLLNVFDRISLFQTKWSTHSLQVIIIRNVYSLIS